MALTQVHCFCCFLSFLLRKWNNTLLSVTVCQLTKHTMTVLCLPLRFNCPIVLNSRHVLDVQSACPLKHDDASVIASYDSHTMPWDVRQVSVSSAAAGIVKQTENSWVLSCSTWVRQNKEKCKHALSLPNRITLHSYRISEMLGSNTGATNYH